MRRDRDLKPALRNRTSTVLAAKTRAQDKTIDRRAAPLLYSGAMTPLVRRARIFPRRFARSWSIATARARINRDLATAHSQAMAEFQAGNYAKAATDLEALVARVAVTPHGRADLLHDRLRLFQRRRLSQGDRRL